MIARYWNNGIEAVVSAASNGHVAQSGTANAPTSVQRSFDPDGGQGMVSGSLKRATRVAMAASPQRRERY
jgi:hypothetical protein